MLLTTTFDLADDRRRREQSEWVWLKVAGLSDPPIFDTEVWYSRFFDVR